KHGWIIYAPTNKKASPIRGGGFRRRRKTEGWKPTSTPTAKKSLLHHLRWSPSSSEEVKTREYNIRLYK
ncbi:MAG: hypothetical protein J6C34_06405, partial [Oscillospiraceae bacterium]|nr:hypothetical protein [Oscillospiraceae bacterium]